MKFQTMAVVLLASMMARAEGTCEFYGIEFGKPSGISTNELTLHEGEGWTESTDANNVTTRKNYCTRTWTGMRKDLVLPADILDQCWVSYSYRTITPTSAYYYGHFPKGSTRKECLRLMDALVEELKAKYGIELACGDDRCEDEPQGFVCKDPPKKLKDPHYRYCPSGRFGTHFVRYADSHEPLHVQMDASESAFGERVVTLRVHLYRANGGEISDREGRMSAAEYEAWKTRRTKTGVH